MGSVVAGRYRLGERIGRGGMADVFRADDELLHRPVALKVFRLDTPAGQDRRRIDAEVRILAALRHPGLVTVFDAGSVDEPGGESPSYLVMELINGPTLGDRLADGPLTAEQTSQLGADLSTTLSYIHASGVVHRDIKPANILLDTEGVGEAAFSAKLTDFGIARLLDSTRYLPQPRAGYRRRSRSARRRLLARTGAHRVPLRPGRVSGYRYRSRGRAAASSTSDPDRPRPGVDATAHRYDVTGTR